MQQLEQQQLPAHSQDTLKDLVARLQQGLQQLDGAYRPSYLDMSAARTLSRIRLPGESREG